MQPIVDVRAHKVFAYEALLRCKTKVFDGPMAILQAAIAQGSVGELGRAVRRMATAAAPKHNVFLNIHPNEFDEGWLVRPDDPIFNHDQDVFLEVTESVPLSHFRLCQSVLAEVRSKGVYLVVDDLGAGYSNLKYIADLYPEIVKLDRDLIMNLDKQPRLHKLVTAIVRICEELGAKVVAEGIETPGELKAARDAGVHYAQGYLIARPAFPVPEVDWSKLRR
jgi:EAL domain-containing protein (putative c-di-GMP-specific phosphodiesterase class I)